MSRLLPLVRRMVWLGLPAVATVGCAFALGVSIPAVQPPLPEPPAPIGRAPRPAAERIDVPVRVIRAYRAAVAAAPDTAKARVRPRPVTVTEPRLQRAGASPAAARPERPPEDAAPEPAEPAPTPPEPVSQPTEPTPEPVEPAPAPAPVAPSPPPPVPAPPEPAPAPEPVSQPEPSPEPAVAAPAPVAPTTPLTPPVSGRRAPVKAHVKALLRAAATAVASRFQQVPEMAKPGKPYGKHHEGRGRSDRAPAVQPQEATVVLVSEPETVPVAAVSIDEARVGTWTGDGQPGDDRDRAHDHDHGDGRDHGERGWGAEGDARSKDGRGDEGWNGKR